jgi:hypothetical protein
MKRTSNQHNKMSSVLMIISALFTFDSMTIEFFFYFVCKKKQYEANTYDYDLYL